MSDAQLVQKILSGDKLAVSLFYRTYEPKLVTYLRMKVTNINDAEEILQDTLFAFLEALRDYTGKASLKTFLYAIANHKIVDYYRRKKMKHVVFSQIPQLELIVSPLLTPEEELDTVHMKEKIRATLRRIIPQYRELLVYKYLEDMSVSAIAKRYTASVKSIESRLARARKAFVEAFVSI